MLPGAAPFKGKIRATFSHSIHVKYSKNSRTAGTISALQVDIIDLSHASGRADPLGPVSTTVLKRHVSVIRL